MRRPSRIWLTAALCVPPATLLAACGAASRGPDVRGGESSHGPQLIAAYGCGACHAIGGVSGADGRVGPSLKGFADRRYIAGRLPNTPANLVRWIINPQAVDPGTLMPDLDVGDPQARDIAAYLYRH
jgi:cytochrome c2